MKAATVAFVAAALLLPSEADALGLGVNLTYSYRTGTWEDEQPPTSELKFSSNDLGVGLTLDTAVAMRRLFNYRLTINYQHAWVDLSTPARPDLGTLPYDGLEVDNTFGFGVIRTRSLRWWLGPSIRLSVGRAQLVTTEGDVFLTVLVENIPQVDIGAGIVTGVNLHWLKNFSLSATLGYHINRSQVTMQGSSSTNDLVYAGRTHRISVGLVGFFRFKSDVY